MSLMSKKCFNHADRVAGAKCLECGNFFCAECITAHEGRRTCSNCLKQLHDHEKGKRSRKSHLTIIMAIAGGVILIMLFYAIGTKLIELGDRDLLRFRPGQDVLGKQVT